MSLRLLPLATLVATLLVGVVAVPVRGQGSGCEWLEGTRNLNSRTVGQNRVTYASTPRIRCDDGRYMQADSALQFQASGYSEFIGNVFFRDRGRTLRARHATYYENLGRLEADGSVVLVEADGNELRGDRLLYLRSGPMRPVELLTMAGGRPEAVLYPTGGDDGPRPDSVRPYLVEADRIFLQGDDLFQAQGDVEVVRDSLNATADSLDYDQAGGALELRGRPARLERGELDLAGRRLRILLPGDVIEEVVAREEGVLTTDSLTVDAPFIRLFLDAGELRRMVAAVPSGSGTDSSATAPRSVLAPPTGVPTAGRAGRAADRGADDDETTDSLPRAVATTREIVMRADSIDVLAPGQRLQRMVAVGSARAVSMARDSLNAPGTPDLIRHDWIEGDTVVAIFTGYRDPDARPDTLPGDSTASREAVPPGDSVGVEAAASAGFADRIASAGSEAASDSAGEAQLESLRAVLDARSLYRLDPDSAQLGDTTAFRGRLPVSYVEARGILLTFEDGQVVHFLYDGLRRGEQLQPVRLPGEVAETPDSAVADTLGLPPDTGRARAGTTAAVRPDGRAAPSGRGGSGLRPRHREHPLRSTPWP